MANTSRHVHIVRLAKTHRKNDFDCGVEKLNECLYRYAGQKAKNGISVTYVALEEESDEILGFYSISNGEVMHADLPESEARKLPRYPVPVVRIGHLATSLGAKGQGIGELLLIDALKKALSVSEKIGIRAVEVDAKSPEARSFYSQYGFVQLADDNLHLYLSLGTIRKLGWSR